jgi:hypothetical protein
MGGRASGPVGRPRAGAGYPDSEGHMNVIIDDAGILWGRVGNQTWSPPWIEILKIEDFDRITPLADNYDARAFDNFKLISIDEAKAIVMARTI